MNKKILLTLAAAAMLGLAACGGNQPASSSSSAPASSSSESSAIDTRFDGGIVDLEVGVPADVDGVVAQILSKGITLADGKGAVYVYGEDIAKGVKVGDYIHVEGEVQNYYGVYEIAKPTFTKKEGGQRGLADIVTEAVEMTEAKVQEIFDAIKACAGEGKTPYSVENQIPYKMTGVTAVANDKGPAFKLGNSKLLCPHYYLPANNRTEANRKNEIFEGVEYDVYFYVGGTNSTNNLDIHIYDAVAKFAAPESVSAAAVVELDRGEIISLTASVLPANANQGLVWSVVSGGDYIQLKQNRVKGIAAGEAVIRAAAAADETKYADIAITVSDPEVAYSTSLLTIDDFNTEGEYIGDEFVLSEIDGKSSASYGEFDFPKDKEASVSTVEATDGIFQVTIDVYGKYNNLKVYAGEEEIKGVQGDTWYGKVGSDYSYTYTLDYAKNIVIKNPGEYKVSAYAIEVRFIKGHEPEGGDPEPSDEFEAAVSYDFTTLDEGNNATATETIGKYGAFSDGQDMLPVIGEKMTITGEDKMTAATAVSKVYLAQSSQGPGVKGIKLGTGSAAGKVEFTFSQAYSQALVQVHRWSATKLAKIKVNGVESTLTADSDPEDLIIDLAEGTVKVTIESDIYSVVTALALK